MKLFSSKVTEARKAVKTVTNFDQLIPKIEVFRFKDRLPRERYYYDDKKRYGIDRLWLSKWVKDDIWESDLIIIHDPNFDVHGALGWHTVVNNFTVLQTFARQDRPHPDYDLTQLEYTILHELGHYFYRKRKMIDRTHYWDYELKDLTGMFIEIRLASPSMVERWIAKMFNSNFEEYHEIPWTLHHTGGVNHTLKGLLNSNKYHDRPVFYNIIIDKEGRLHHYHNKPNRRGKKGYDMNIAVLGNYTKEEPTPAVVNTLRDFLKDKAWLPHNQLAELGLATKSECPGNLIKYV